MGLDLELTTIASSDVDPDGFPRVQAQGLGKDPITRASYVLQPFGTASCPLDPDVDSNGEPTEGCLFLQGHEGDQAHALLQNDSRLTEKLPPRPKGSHVLYGAVGETPADARKTPSIAMFDSSKGGSFTLLVPHQGGSTSSGVFVSVDTPGSEAVQLRHGLGMGLALVAGGKNPVVVNNKAGDAVLVLDDDGFQVTAAKVTVSGAVVLGDPDPLSPSPAKALVNADLIAWLTGVLLPALASAPVGGGPIVVAPPPAGALTTKVFGS